MLKDRPKARKAWGIWSPKANPKVPLHERYHFTKGTTLREGNGPNEKGHG